MASLKVPIFTFDQAARANFNSWHNGMINYGYYPANSVTYAIQQLFKRRAIKDVTGAQAILLEGPPGVGKTQLAEVLSMVTGAPLMPYQMHAWSDADELYAGISVKAAVAGDAANVIQPGVLAQVAARSQKGPTMLLLDEIDKAPERVEALLLDYLQSGRVPIAPGQHLVTNLKNVIVFITSNDMRPLTDAFLRRVRRLSVPPLPFHKQVEVVYVTTGGRFPQKGIEEILKAGTEVAVKDGAVFTIQEARNLVYELYHTQKQGFNVGREARLRGVKQPKSGNLTRAAMVSFALQGWAARGESGRSEALIQGPALSMQLESIGFFAE